MPGTPTARLGLATTDPEDFVNDWPGVQNAVVTTLDQLMAIAITDDPRPAAETFGRFHLAADGTLSFDTGAAWIDLTPATAVSGLSFVGMIAFDAGNSDISTASQEWMRADGRLVDRTTYATYFARVGHAHNGGVDPGGNMVRLPDYRGRAPVGADNMGTTTGAAGRLPNSNRVRGQNGGEERHTSTTAETPAHSHGNSLSDPGHGHNFSIRYMHALDNSNYPHQHYADQGNAAEGISGFGGIGATYGWPVSGSGTGVSISNANAGGGGAHNNMQPYGVDNVMVRVR